MPTEITSIIPTYRRPRLLTRAIRSVLSQSYPHFRCCVYDNASDDDTAAAVGRIARYDSRVEYHRHPSNIGMMPNFAFGISRVETPYFNILSDDDFLLPGFFETAVTMLSVDSAAGFFFGGLLFADGNGVVAAPSAGWNIEGRVGPSVLFRMLFPGDWITWTATLFRTHAIAAAGGLKPELGYGADVELLLRLSVRNSAIVSRQPCAVMDLHHGSASAADGGQEYSAGKILAILESLEDAIVRARKEEVISPAEASAMRLAVTEGLDWRFVRRALVLIAQGHRDSAAEVAESLHLRRHRAVLAGIVRLAAGANPAGFLIRVMLSSLRQVRGALRKRSNRLRYGLYAGLVEDVTRRLEAADSERAYPEAAA